MNFHEETLIIDNKSEEFSAPDQHAKKIMTELLSKANSKFTKQPQKVKNNKNDGIASIKFAAVNPYQQSSPITKSINC